MDESSVNTSEYLVVFIKNKQAGHEEGIITWSAFQSKADFDAWWKSDAHAHVRAVEDILKEGVTEEEAIALTKKTSRLSYLRSAIGNARINGVIHVDLLEHELTNLAVLDNS